MIDESSTKKTPPVERRRFLRESLQGSVPLLVGWISGGARSLMKLASGEEPRRTSAPPAAAAKAPAAAKDALDQRQQDFARDNPGSGDYPA